MAMDYDTWLQSGPGGPLDDSAPGGDIDFTMKLRGGRVRVYASGYMETEQDYDGISSYFHVDITQVHWTFDPDGDADVTEEEMDEIKEVAKEIFKDC